MLAPAGGGFADVFERAEMIGEFAVGEVEPADVGAFFEEADESIDLGRGGAECCDDFSSDHGINYRGDAEAQRPCWLWLTMWA